MQAELEAMEANNTWSVVSLPPDKHSIKCKWNYKVKYNVNDSTEMYKVHLVAKG